MRILVLGASGFIGTRLVRQLVQTRVATGDHTTIVASDMQPGKETVKDSATTDIRYVTGNILDTQLFDTLFAQPFDAVFHLAAMLTVDAEKSLENGLDTNVHALMRLLEKCRAQPRPPKFIFTSSISTFGGPLPDMVNDYVNQAPQTSYGTHKVIAEHLIDDYSRRGLLDGRTLRLPIILTHPGAPGATISDRISALIREPLNGRNMACPIKPDTPIAVGSVDRAVASMLKLMELPASAFDYTRAMNMPALTVTPRQIVDAVSRRLAPASQVGMDWQLDPVVQRVVESWPCRFTSERALQLGIEPDASVDAIVDAYLSERDRTTKP